MDLIPQFLKEWALTKGGKLMFSKLWSWMDGKKMNIGGIATILSGVAKLGLSYSSNHGFDEDGWKLILAGWGMIAAKSAIAKTQPPAAPPTSQP